MEVIFDGINITKGITMVIAEKTEGNQ